MAMNALILASFACGYPAPSPTQLQQEFHRLEGTWRVIDMEHNGEPMDPAVVAAKPRLLIEGVRLRPLFELERQVRIEIDPSLLEMAHTVPRGRGGNDEDYLRPESFDTSRASVIAYVLKREKK
jgi:hypothetical protein